MGYSNRTSVVRNGAGKEVCSHCGGVVPPQRPYDYDPYTNPDGMDPPSSFKTTPWDSDNDLYDRYCGKAKSYSIGGNHSAAIEIYKKVVDFLVPGTEYEILAAIADEYEAMGDYVLAEDYWMRCCAIAQQDSIYEYIARKGDFLYRRERYGQAISEYPIKSHSPDR